MISFQKIISDHHFSFFEDVHSHEPRFNITVDIYVFAMIPGEAGWKIKGDVPPWILSIEAKLGDVIDSALM